MIGASTDNASIDASSVAKNSTEFVVDSPCGSSSICPSDSLVVHTAAAFVRLGALIVARLLNGFQAER